MNQPITPQTGSESNTDANLPKDIGKGTSNPTDNSYVECRVNRLQIDVFFDGTWNSRYNSDRYNTPNPRELSLRLNEPGMEKRTRRPFDGDTTRAEHLLKKEYRADNTSFARAPTGVDQMARAFSGGERVVALYVDGAGTVTPYPVRSDAQPISHEHTPDNRHSNLKDYQLTAAQFSSDSMVGSGLGMGDSGVYGKLGQMLRKIYITIQQRSATIQIDCVCFNVYGFSRGAATARMFVHRMLKYGFDQDITKEVDKLLNQEHQYLHQQPFDHIPDRENPRPKPSQLSFKDVLTSPKFSVKLVGLFDTVSSIGANHDDDVKDEKQQLVFDEHRRPNLVVHIAAAHEFRQKFALVNIAQAVQAGCGFEVLLPGCHTDIGDGLATRWTKDEETNPDTGQKDWSIKHVEDPTTICQKYDVASIPFMALTKAKLFSPLVFSQVVQAEEKALLNLQRAKFEQVIDNLVAQGWFVQSDDQAKNEIRLDRDIARLDKIKVERKFNYNSKSGIENISPNYPKIATRLMYDIMSDLGLHHPYRFDKYDLQNFGEQDKVGQLTSIAKDLIDQALVKYDDYKSNKTQYYISHNIINGSQDNLGSYIKIKEQLRPVLFHDYLHWCSKMERGFLDLLITHVSVPQINPTTNQFYRTVYQG